MLMKLAMGIAVVIDVSVMLGLTKPDSFHVERSAPVAAQSDFIFPLVNDFTEWDSMAIEQNASAVDPVVTE